MNTEICANCYGDLRHPPTSDRVWVHVHNGLNACQTGVWGTTRAVVLDLEPYGE